MKLIRNSDLVTNDPRIMPRLNRIGITSGVGNLTTIIVDACNRAFDNNANMLGLTIETVSRKITALEKMGAIVRTGKRGIELVDPAQLSDLAAG